MAVLTLDIPDTTLKAMHELAEITDVAGDDRSAGLVVDALRAFEWIIAQQAQGRTVTALEEADMKTLSQSERISGEREALSPFIAQNKLHEARVYFERGA
jgi:hypothetical protein